MTLSHKARKRWALVILLVGLPVYIVAAITVIGLFERPSFLVEIAVYVILGVIWAFPFKFVFKGVAREDPDAAGDRDA
jgi:uncharacterized membrane protein YhdT